MPEESDGFFFKVSRKGSLDNNFSQSLSFIPVCLSYREAGGCRAPRAGTDSVCCSLPGENPPPRLLKNKEKIIIREKKYLYFFSHRPHASCRRGCCRGVSPCAGRRRSMRPPEILRVSHQLCEHFARGNNVPILRHLHFNLQCS